MPIPLADGDPDVVIRADDSPHLQRYVGRQIVTTDGTTLLGADDKAGVAIVMTAARRLLADEGDDREDPGDSDSGRGAGPSRVGRRDRRRRGRRGRSPTGRVRTGPCSAPLARGGGRGFYC